MSNESPFDPQLLNFGYAPGNYIIKCWDCKQDRWDCDKRAARCKECAERRMRDQMAMYQGLE